MPRAYVSPARSIGMLLAVLAGVLAWALGGGAQSAHAVSALGLSGPTDYFGWGATSSGATADMDRDGSLDVIGCGPSSEVILVRWGAGDGTLPSYSGISSAQWEDPVSVALGDFDRDGKPDVAAAASGNSQIVVLRSDGGRDLTYWARATHAVAGAPVDVLVGDLDHNGTQDLVAALSTAGAVAVLSGNGSGGFSVDATQPAVGTYPIETASGDFDGDGNLDLAVANRDSGNVSILMGDDDRTFTHEATLTVGTKPSSIACGDFDKDGNADLAIAVRGLTAVSNDGYVAVRNGVGDGTFSIGTTVVASATWEPSRVSLDDIDKNGWTDAVVTDASSGSEKVWVFAGGGGGGGFADGSISRSTPAGPEDATTGDLNRDGKPEVVTLNSTGNEYNVYTNTSVVPRGAQYTLTTETACGTNPEHVAVGDFDRDGKMDMAVTNYGGSSVSIRLGLGTGDFTVASNVPVGQWPHEAAVADFDNDGKLDFATCHIAQRVSVRMGNGDGTFSIAPTLTPDASTSWGITTGDFNRDGNADLFVCSYAGDVYLGNGDGTFSHGALSLPVSPSYYGVADMDRNGTPDIVAACGSSVRTLLGNGTGGFPTVRTLSTKADDVAIGDLDRDGVLDLAMAQETSGTVQPAFGVGDGTFTLGVPRASGTQPKSVEVADLNRDGTPDFASAAFAGGSVPVRTGYGDGTFYSAANPLQGGAYHATTADFNGDGVPDLAAASYYGGVRVWIGTGVDAMPPKTFITTSPAAPDGADGWYVTTPTVTLSKNETGTTYYAWDTPSGYAAHAGGALPMLEGSHTLYVSSWDDVSPTPNRETTQTRGFKVDTGDPIDPGLSSSSHTTSTPSTDAVVQISMSGATDTASGVAGFGVSWTQNGTGTPPATVNLAADATGFASSSLADGNWWVNVRTADAAGHWTSTVHLGPFVIDAQPDPASLTCAPSATRVVYAGTVTISGVLTDGGGNPIGGPGRTVQLYKSNNYTIPSPTYVYVTDAVWDAGSGTYRADASLISNTAFHLKSVADSEYVAAQSGNVLVRSKALLTRPTMSTYTPRRNTYFTMTGYLRPGHLGKTRVEFFRKVGSRYVLYRWGYGTNKKLSRTQSRWTLRYKPPSAGYWKIRARHWDTGHDKTYSAERFFRVR